MYILTLYGSNNVFMYNNNMFLFGRLFLCSPATHMSWVPYYIKYDLTGSHAVPPMFTSLAY